MNIQNLSGLIRNMWSRINENETYNSVYDLVLIYLKNLYIERLTEEMNSGKKSISTMEMIGGTFAIGAFLELCRKDPTPNNFLARLENLFN